MTSSSATPSCRRPPSAVLFALVLGAAATVSACGGSTGTESGAPSGLAYSTNPATYTVGTPIPTNQASTSGGRPTLFHLSAALPAGLRIDTDTGAISGTPSAAAPATTFTVTASNSAGSTTVPLVITVNDVAPTSLAYAANPATYTVGAAIAPNAPTVSGGRPTSYSVAPTLPSGLALNASTGVVSGTATVVSPTTTYTVTASNPAGSVTASLVLSVEAPNAQPVASAGSPQRVPVGTAVSLDGTASLDPDGNSLTYGWTLTTRPPGSNAVLTSATTARPSFVADVAGTYLATLVVNDGRVNSSPATVSILCASDLRLLISRSASQSGVWVNGVAQAGSQFSLLITNISSSTTFPLNRAQFLNGGNVLWTSTDPGLLNGNSLAPGQSAGIVITINVAMAVDFFNPIRFAYFLTDPTTLDEFAVDATFAMAGSDYELPPVSTVAVTLGSSSLSVGGSTQASAAMRDGSGASLPGRIATWSSSNRSVATVDSAGRVTAVGSGTARIRALSEGQSGTADLIVSSAVSTVTVSLGATNLVPGQTTQASAVPRDGGGNVLTGRTITWSSQSPGVATVSTSGLVTAVGVGPATIQATCDGVVGSSLLAVVASNGTPTQMEAVSATSQTGPPSLAAVQAPAVLVKDATGAPVSGVSVTFTVTAGGGSITGGSATTDAFGKARATTWTFGPAGGQSVRASSAAIPGVTVDFAGLSREPTQAFDITLRLVSSMSDSQALAFLHAKERIQEFVVGDLPIQNVNLSASQMASCGGVAVQQEVDDVVILAEVGPIDGVSNILGQAGPCYLRSASSWPVVGHMMFDTADLDALEASGRLEYVILHEMMHVIGFGTIWTNKGLLQNPSASGGTDPTFSGANAIANLATYNGGAFYTGAKVPVEATGGAGTRDGHWRETVFNHELMTGYLDTGVNPISATTIGSFQDLGYVVDVSRADGFDLATALRIDWNAVAEPLDLGADVRREPPGYLGPNGLPLSR